MYRFILLLIIFYSSNISHAQELYRCNEGIYFWANSEPCVLDSKVQEYKSVIVYLSGILAQNNIKTNYTAELTCKDICPVPIVDTVCPQCPPLDRSDIENLKNVYQKSYDTCNLNYSVCNTTLVKLNTDISQLENKITALNKSVQYYQNKSDKNKADFEKYRNKYEILKKAFCYDSKGKITLKCKFLGVPG